MGSFSWTKADRLTKVANVVEGKPFKFLIPKEFGGGYIKDHYQGYGRLGLTRGLQPKYDMYELQAFWNADEETRRLLRYDGEFPLMKEIDENTDHNRHIGIEMGCYDYDVDALRFPLKLVSASYKGTYEDCDGRSYNDPTQGWHNLSWAEHDRILEMRRSARFDQ